MVSEPFAVAYGVNALDNAMVIDIGAGTVDFCIMHGTVPTEEDQRTVLTAGDYIDQQLYNFLEERYPHSDFNLNMVRRFKEEFSFVGEPGRAVKVNIPVDGRPTKHDITEEMRRACESILPAVVESTLELIAKFDPEYQDIIRQNIILAGGGSQIRGLREYLENALKEFGPAKVQDVRQRPLLYSGATGAMALAADMPEKYWQESRQHTRASPRPTGAASDCARSANPRDWTSSGSATGRKYRRCPGFRRSTGTGAESPGRVRTVAVLLDLRCCSSAPAFPLILQPVRRRDAVGDRRVFASARPGVTVTARPHGSAMTVSGRGVLLDRAANFREILQINQTKHNSNPVFPDERKGPLILWSYF